MSAIIILEKGRKPLPVGTIKDWKGGKYIKTTTGWVPHRTGAKGDKGEKPEGASKIERMKSEIESLGFKISKTPNGNYAVANADGTALGLIRNDEDFEKVYNSAKKYSAENGGGKKTRGRPAGSKNKPKMTVGGVEKKEASVPENKMMGKRFGVANGDYVSMTFKNPDTGKTETVTGKIYNDDSSIAIETDSGRNIGGLTDKHIEKIEKTKEPEKKEAPKDIEVETEFSDKKTAQKKYGGKAYIGTVQDDGSLLRTPIPAEQILGSVNVFGKEFVIHRLFDGRDESWSNRRYAISDPVSGLVAFPESRLEFHGVKKPVPEQLKMGIAKMMDDMRKKGGDGTTMAEAKDHFSKIVEGSREKYKNAKVRGQADAEPEMSDADFDEAWVKDTKREMEKEKNDKLYKINGDIGKIRKMMKDTPDDPANKSREKKIKEWEADIESIKSDYEKKEIKKPSEFMSADQIKYHKAQMNKKD
jgi:hypothetical protein